MEIEYIYPDNNKDEEDKFKKQLHQMERENTLGCLVISLVLLIGLFVFLSLLPFILIVIGYSILGLGIYIIYKAYLEEYVYRLIQWLKSR